MGEQHMMEWDSRWEITWEIGLSPGCSGSEWVLDNRAPAVKLIKDVFTRPVHSLIPLLCKDLRPLKMRVALTGVWH